MMKNLSTKIGIAAVLLILILALSTVFASAQTVTVTPTATVTASPSPTVSPATLPAIVSFTIEMPQSGDENSNAADVTLTVDLRNFEATTDVPTTTPTSTPDGTVQGLIKYCYDMATPTPSATLSPTVTVSPGLSPSPTVTLVPTVVSPSPSPSPSVVPTATNNSIPAITGACLLSAETSFTFSNVPMGLHTFNVELVNFDGSSLSTRAYITIQVMVIPTS